jgi:hypothetical protein
MEYRQAKLDDCKAILLLNHKYYQAYIDGDKDKGFLKNQFNLEQIKALIMQNEVVVAVFEDNIIGYYLTNSIFETDVIIQRKTQVQELILKGKIKNVKYVYQTQAVIDKPYMRSGIGKELLKHLKRLVQSKFDFLIGYIDAENKNAKEAHLKSGWMIFTDTENGWLAMTDVNEI